MITMDSSKRIQSVTDTIILQKVLKDNSSVKAPIEHGGWSRKIIEEQSSVNRCISASTRVHLPLYVEDFGLSAFVSAHRIFHPWCEYSYSME
jgi:hypothetical protein